MPDVQSVLLNTLERIGAEVSELRPNLHLENDLGVESLMRMELATKLEKKLAVPIGDQIDGLETVGELLEFLEHMTSADAAGSPERMAS